VSYVTDLKGYAGFLYRVTDLECFETDPLVSYVTDLKGYAGFFISRD